MIVKGTVLEVITAIMKKYEVKNVFGLAAAQISGLMDAVSKDPYFNYVTVRHEECAGHTAHGAVKATGQIACCFATVGPGASNLFPGVAAAYNDNSPLLVLTGNNQLRDVNPSRDLLQELDQVSVYKNVTKFSEMVVVPSRVPELMVEALRIAVAGRPGPVHLDIPCDVGMLPCEVDLNALPDSIRPYRTVPLPEQIEEAARLFAGARKPLLVVGGGVNRSEAEAQFRRLLDLTNAPATSTFNAKGVIPPDYPGYLGAGGFLAGEAMISATREADVVLSVGCKFSSWILIDKKPNYAKPTGQKLIQLDVEPKAIGRNVDVDLGLVGDARETLKLLIAALESQPMNIEADWVSELQAEHTAYMAKMDEVADVVYSTIGGGELLNEAAIARTIANEIPADAIVCFDGGAAMQWFQTYIHPRDGRSSLYNPGMGHLGSGLPFANAAKLNNPDRPVFCLTADGALGLTVSELETAARSGLDIVCIVCNDSHWGMYRSLGEQVYVNHKFGTALTSVDFSMVAKGFGCDGEKIDKLEDLPAAIKRGVQSTAPYVIDVVCDWTPHPQDPCYGDGFYPDWAEAMAKALVARAEQGENE